ncbi:10819_t:CDS:2 [Acaulospora morrowiae]|uniref:10819_t:CDS:1 n=1 Tax=Acaulospora morrowiae TaxID=94023 RepID=A0A9N8WSL3_9GLOM|nr:10819_t:CDS:2 [Acaulospora morrowiae]
MSAKINCKIVVVGLGAVGKTALIIQDYNPTIEDVYRGQAVIDNKPCNLEVLDTSGQEEYYRYRDMSISDGDAFIIVYAINCRDSFECVKMFRDQILRVKDSDKVPIILVGNKCDKTAAREVTIEEGMNMGREFDCEYIETSAKQCINVDRSFHTVVRTFREMRNGRKIKTMMSLSKKDGIESFNTSKDPIYLYDYSSFGDLTVIDDGAFGKISRAFSRGHNKLVVLKSVDLKHFTLEQLDNEEELRILLFNIIFGARETIVKGTPIKYAEIYKACWKENPNLRPDITQVMKDLNNVDINDTIEDIDKYYNENGGYNQFDFNLTGHNNNVLKSDDLSCSRDISSLILERINSLERQFGNLGNTESNQDDQNLYHKKSWCKCLIL